MYLILDNIRLLVWMQSKDGAKGRNRPKPFSPLAEEAKRKKDQASGRHYGRTDLPPGEVIELMHQVANGVWSKPGP